LSTRSAIVRVTGEGKFTGVYHHWDGYTEGLGQELWHLYRNRYNKNLDAMLKELIDDHPAGWSTLVGADWSKKIGYKEKRELANNAPACYCHGDRNEKAQVINEKNASRCGCEWVYAFTREKNKDYMLILCSFTPTGNKMIGMFGFGDPDATWKTIAKTDLSKKEPNWRKLSCHAYA
jgi:hypothetical protein